MKCPAFAYARPESEEELLALLDRHGDDARILAGGQSLMPMLAMRLAAPAVVIDINALPGLGEIVIEGDDLKIGALVRHADLERSPLVEQYTPLLKQAVVHVAHRGIRNRGTLCGSLALADPAAEMPCPVLALGGTMVLRSSRGEREITAGDFFQGIYTTALEPDEYLAAVRVPIAHPGEHHLFHEIARRRGDYALAGVAMRAVCDGEKLTNVSAALLAVSDRPVLARKAAALVRTCDLGRLSADDLAAAFCEEVEIGSSYQASAAVRRHYLRTIAARLLQDLQASAEEVVS